ncbi:MAG: hypothetical protein J1E05_01295 [Eubacterium sp.]|nr:hypothetical protein [Eubacterium sp.]
MRMLKSDRKYILIILFLQFVIGIYIGMIRLDPDLLESHAFDVLFFYAREGIYIDLTSREFDVQVLIGVLDVVISIPLLSCIMNRNYLSKCYYAATRLGNYKKLYLGETFKNLFICFVSGVIYSLGIAVMAFTSSDKTLYSVNTLSLMTQSVLAYTLILFMFVQIASIISVLFNEKIGMIVVTAFFIGFTALIFLLPLNMKQWDMVSWYFVTVYTEQKEAFYYSPIVYYTFAMVFDCLICFVGYKALKKKDIL